MKKFLTLVLLNSKVFAQTTGIVGLDDEISIGTRILQFFLFLFAIVCISYAAWLFGSGKAKQQGLEMLFGILIMIGLAVGGIAWWTGKTSGFLI